MRSLIVELPDEIVFRLESKWQDLPLAALEAILADAYRDGLLTAEHVRRALGLETRMEVDEFLKRHDVPAFTVEDFQRDRATLQQWRNSHI